MQFTDIKDAVEHSRGSDSIAVVKFYGKDLASCLHELREHVMESESYDYVVHSSVDSVMEFWAMSDGSMTMRVHVLFQSVEAI